MSNLLRQTETLNTRGPRPRLFCRMVLRFWNSRLDNAMYRIAPTRKI